MKKTILSLITGAAIITTSYGAHAHQENNNETTIIQNLKELKDNIKETAQLGTEKFNEKLKSVYDKLSTKVDDIETALKDKKDNTAEALRKKLNDIKQAMTNYKNATEDKAEEMRIKLIDNLENLNNEIEDYNIRQKK